MRSDKENEYHVLDRTRSRRVLQTRRSNTKTLCGIRECEYSIVWKHTAVEISDGDGAAAADMPKKDLDRPWQGAAEETFHSAFGTVHMLLPWAANPCSREATNTTSRVDLTSKPEKQVSAQRSN